MSKVIYLTGAPASGKSSLTRLLLEVIPNLLVWEYGARLTAYVRIKSGVVTHQAEVREHSSKVVTSEDVQEVDRQLIQFVQEKRGVAPIMIDSHAVTKEHFGFRITPFSQALLQQLAPDEIWVLHASPHTTIQRIRDSAEGRPLVSADEAAFHSALQASLAAAYAAQVGCPMYVFSTEDSDRTALVGLLRARLS